MYKTIFSKILEKLYNARLKKFLNRYDLLCPSQYGFRSNVSTSHAISQSVEEITNSLDNNKYSIGVFIDLKKAFDTVDHDVSFLSFNLNFQSVVRLCTKLDSYIIVSYIILSFHLTLCNVLKYGEIHMQQT